MSLRDSTGINAGDPTRPQPFEGLSVPEFYDQAVCAQTDPEAFYPDKGNSVKAAKQTCLGCGVREKCLEYALDNNERFGVWGGLSDRERRAVSKARREAAA